MAVSGETRRRLTELVRTHDDRPELHGRPMLDEMDALGGIPAAGELAGSSSIDDRFVAARLMHRAAPVRRLASSRGAARERRLAAGARSHGGGLARGDVGDVLLTRKRAESTRA